MRFALMLESQQGLSYGDHVAIAKRAEANGIEALFRSDHYTSFPGPGGQPTTDAWTVVAGLARETDRIGLGVLVSPVTFRHPGSFAKVVTTVDEMSGGRIEVGVGAGWNDIEHSQLGLSFPDIKERADLMEDQLAILHGLWGEPDGWSFEGHQVTIKDASFHPKPVDVPGRPRSADRRRTTAVAGRWSGLAAHLSARRAIRGRVQSVVIGAGEGTSRVRCGRCGVRGDRSRPSDPRPLDDGGGPDRTRRGRDGHRLAAAVKAFASGDDDSAWLEERLERWITGTPDDAREQVRRFAEAGAERIMLQDFLPWDLDMIDVMGEVLVGQV